MMMMGARALSLPSLLLPLPSSSLTLLPWRPLQPRSCTAMASQIDPPPPPSDLTTEELELRLTKRRRPRSKDKPTPTSPIASKPPPKDWDSMTLPEKALELYVGEKGALFWLNKLAYAAIFVVVGGWIAFRFIGPALGWYQLESPLLPPDKLFK